MKNMKNEVIRIPGIEDNNEEKPLELTHIVSSSIIHADTWGEFDRSDIKEYDKIVYLGHCKVDGDLFAGYSDGIIDLFRGNLNSGKY